MHIVIIQAGYAKTISGEKRLLVNVAVQGSRVGVIRLIRRGIMNRPQKARRHKMKIFISENSWADRFDIYITEEGYNGKRMIAKPMDLVFEEIDEGSPQQPSIKISRFFGKQTNFLQALSDALAKCGYEPITVEENKGELKATKVHLEDMRKLVFKKAKA